VVSFAALFAARVDMRVARVVTASSVVSAVAAVAFLYAASNGPEGFSMTWIE
jgi:hypothetical protein